MHKLIVGLIGIAVINLLLAIVFSEPVKERQVAVLLVLSLGFTAFGFVSGALLALVSYKNLPYRKKYLPASFICIFLLHLIWLTMKLTHLVPVYVAWSKGYC